MCLHGVINFEEANGAFSKIIQHDSDEGQRTSFTGKYSMRNLANIVVEGL